MSPFAETYGSRFPVIATSYEECRAECVGIYLCVEREVLAIFGHTNGDVAEDIFYVNWLMMARAGALTLPRAHAYSHAHVLFTGLTALEFYDPSTQSWGQAHMQARFAILRILLNAGENLVTITQLEDDITIELDREKILSVTLSFFKIFLCKF